MRERTWEKTFTAAAQSIYAVLQYTDKKDMYTLVDVMGMTGHAFRMNIHPDYVSPVGPILFPPSELLEKGLNILGFTCRHLRVFRIPAPPEKLERAVKFAQETIDRGIPAFACNLFSPEYGVIYGYDDEKQEFICKDLYHEGPIPYAKMIYDPLRLVCMLRIRESVPVDHRQAWKMALNRILQFAREQTRTLSTEFRHGLAGYDAWIRAFRHRTVNPFGNTYNARVVGDAREYAAQFLRLLPAKWQENTDTDILVRELAEEAAVHYEKVAAAFIVFQQLFPYPHGGEPNDPANALEAIQLLERAKASEVSGVAVLERMQEGLCGS